MSNVAWNHCRKRAIKIVIIIIIIIIIIINDKAIVGIRTLEKSGDRMKHLSRF